MPASKLHSSQNLSSWHSFCEYSTHFIESALGLWLGLGIGLGLGLVLDLRLVLRDKTPL